MDANDASAMTEASGLTSDLDSNETMSHSASSERASQDALMRTSDLLRKMTLAAPLSSLAVAFMVGVLVARRR